MPITFSSPRAQPEEAHFLISNKNSYFSSCKSKISASNSLYKSVDSYVVVETKNNDSLHFCTTEIYVPQEYFRMCNIRRQLLFCCDHVVDDVMKAIQIKSKGPNLNRDKGLDLDPVWDTLLQKRGGAK